MISSKCQAVLLDTLMLSLIGLFDIIVDFCNSFTSTSSRGALEALELKDREQYVAIMKECLNTEFSYLLSGYDYDKSLKTGPPRALPPQDVRQLFGKVGSVEILSGEQDDGTRQRFGLPALTKYTYMITGDK